MFQKVKVNPFCDDSPESKYSKLLTAYAVDYVHKQLKLVDKVHEIKEENGQYTVETSEGVKVVTLSSCGYAFNTSMLLPCRHMFVLRYKLQEPLFAAKLCDKLWEPWTAEHYRSTQRMISVYSAQSYIQLKGALTQAQPTPKVL